MSAILLVRHASCEGLGLRLNGRAPGVRLSAQGREEARRLAQGLAHCGAALVLASPRERCLETADEIATVLKARVETLADLDEVDFGPWSGMSFDQLAADPNWTRWNAERATATTPAGESMADVQRRMNRALSFAAARAKHRGAVLVSHAEPIRAAIAGLLGFSLDVWARLEISPASVTRLDAGAGRIVCVNQTFR